MVVLSLNFPQPIPIQLVEYAPVRVFQHAQRFFQAQLPLTCVRLLYWVDPGWTSHSLGKLLFLQSLKNLL